jgi:hypothetical protein
MLIVEMVLDLDLPPLGEVAAKPAMGADAHCQWG